MPGKTKQTISQKRKMNPRLTPVGRGVLAGLKEMAAHRRGEFTLPAKSYNIPGSVDVASVRAKAGRLTQEEFARRYGFNLRTLQDWELGRAEPPAPVRAYLLVIAQAPAATERALEHALKNTA